MLKGFSLVELIICIVIFGVFFAGFYKFYNTKNHTNLSKLNSLYELESELKNQIFTQQSSIKTTISPLNIDVNLILNVAKNENFTLYNLSLVDNNLSYF